jgi:hypothetical protein
MENLREQTAACGIDCFNCEFFTTNIEVFFETMDPQRKAGFAARGATKENLSCKGCRVDGCKMLSGKCATLECIREKGHEFCYECAEFPCVKLQPLAEGAERYPHNLKVFNLTFIKNKGIEAWAAEVKEIREKYFKGRFAVGAGPQLDGKK